MEIADLWWHPSGSMLRQDAIGQMIGYLLATLRSGLGFRNVLSSCTLPTTCAARAEERVPCL